MKRTIQCRHCQAFFLPWLVNDWSKCRGCVAKPARQPWGTATARRRRGANERRDD